MAKCKSCGSPLCKGCGSPATFVDPTMSSVGINQQDLNQGLDSRNTNISVEPQMTFQPPMPANQMGMAKPVFNPAVQASAEAIYGSPEQRQMSMPGAPMFLKEIPKGDKGKGLRALDDSVVKQMGYDAATKMVSPLGMHHPYKAPELDPDFRNPGGNTNMTKTLTEKPKKTTGFRKVANILTGGLGEVAAEVAQRVRDYNYTPQETFTKVKTDMPKKRVNGGNLGYVINVNTGERHSTETIPQAQNIFKKQAKNILKKNK